MNVIFLTEDRMTQTVWIAEPEVGDVLSIPNDGDDELQSYVIDSVNPSLNTVYVRNL